MLYLVTAELHNYALLNAPHEEFVQLMRRVIAPSLELIGEHQEAGKIVAGGVLAASQKLVFILDLPKAESHLSVRQFLHGLPIFGYYRWEVTPLESFHEWLSTVKS
jgi:Muconolactone delta-isomerase